MTLYDAMTANLIRRPNPRRRFLKPHRQVAKVQSKLISYCKKLMSSSQNFKENGNFLDVLQPIIPDSRISLRASWPGLS